MTDMSTPMLPSDITGVQAVPPHHGYAGYTQTPQQRGVTTDTWLRLVMWVIPIIFTAGALVVSVRSMSARQDEQEARLRAEEKRSEELRIDQRILQSKVDSIGVQQDRLVGKIESIDDKLNHQGAQLGAISERIGARRAVPLDQSYPATSVGN